MTKIQAKSFINVSLIKRKKSVDKSFRVLFDSEDLIVKSYMMNHINCINQAQMWVTGVHFLSLKNLIFSTLNCKESLAVLSAGHRRRILPVKSAAGSTAAASGGEQQCSAQALARSRWGRKLRCMTNACYV